MILVCAIFAVVGFGLWRTAHWTWTSAHRGGIWSMCYPVSICAFPLAVGAYIVAGSAAVNAIVGLILRGAA